jgi:aryl-alcohol dehydrogenase-like predicted oxidoreductase
VICTKAIASHPAFDRTWIFAPTLRRVFGGLRPNEIAALHLLFLSDCLHDATPAQVALVWCVARPSITAPIASATNLDQLNDLMGSVSLVLDRSSIGLLNQASAPTSAPASA